MASRLLLCLDSGPRARLAWSAFVLPGLFVTTRHPGICQSGARTISTTKPPKQEDISLNKASASNGLHLTWPHKGWDDTVVLDVVPSHRKPRTVGDHFAWKVTRICRQVHPATLRICIDSLFARWAMDFVTGMGPEQKVDSRFPTISVTAQKPLTESQWVSHPVHPAIRRLILYS